MDVSIQFFSWRADLFLATYTADKAPDPLSSGSNVELQSLRSAAQSGARNRATARTDQTRLAAYESRSPTAMHRQWLALRAGRELIVTDLRWRLRSRPGAQPATACPTNSLHAGGIGGEDRSSNSWVN